MLSDKIVKLQNAYSSLAYAKAKMRTSLLKTKSLKKTRVVADTIYLDFLYLTGSYSTRIYELESIAYGLYNIAKRNRTIFKFHIFAFKLLYIL